MGLEPGRFAVGFKVLYRIDRSRTWDPTPDSTASGEFGRPVRISLWYPARQQRAGTSMLYRDYVHFAAPDSYVARLDSLLEARNIESLTGMFAGAMDSYPKLLQLGTGCAPGSPDCGGALPPRRVFAGLEQRPSE
jgi:hypothetical protein